MIFRQVAERISPRSGDILPDEEIELIAIQSGFQTRAPKKIFPAEFARLLFGQSVKCSPSYNDIASHMESGTGISVSKQAIWQRIDSSCVEFLQRILAKLISAKLAYGEFRSERFSNQYQRILVQDSTLVRLPARLFGAFSGVANADASVCTARIQVVYDLKAGEFVAFSIDSYSKNDLAAAPELVLHLGDLVLRDRGYLTASEIQRHIDAQADCIYRHKHRTIYLDPQTKKPIDLAFMLKTYGRLDMQVLLKNKEQTPVRLVAAPVNEEVANLRRMRAKKENKGHSPSNDNLALMSWTILITTISEAKARFKDLLASYGLRWRIESIFKTWKSNMSFAVIHTVSENQFRSIMIARLSMLVMIFHNIFAPLRYLIQEHYGKRLSMMKLLRYLQVNPERIYSLMLMQNATQGILDQSLLKAIARFCCYDSRKKRRNFSQIEESLFASDCLT